jgi:hypothetical protein
MTTITDEELDQLRTDQARFKWMLRMWANVTGDSIAETVRAVDEARTGTLDLASWDGKWKGSRKARRPG